MSLALYLLAALPALLVFASLVRGRKLRAIPTVGGPSLPLLSYLGALRFARDGPALLQKGYDQHKGGAFKIATPQRWLVVVTGPALVDAVQRLPDAQASLVEGAAELVNTRWLFGPALHANPYHVRVIRTQLTRRLAGAFAGLADEVAAALAALVPAPVGGEWISVPAMPAVRAIVARVSARVFVGLPYCRNEAYLALSIRFTQDVDRGSQLLSFVPRPLKGLAAKYITNIERSIDECTEHLRPLLDARMDDLARFGDEWADKPDDLLQWFIDEERKSGASALDVRNVVRMLLVANFAAILTSSNTFTHALYHLAAHPEYADTLRAEAAAVLAEEGCTKAAMGRLRKLDSFLRESLRLNGINAFSIMRRIMQDVVLADGTALPAGTLVVAPASATHADAAHYARADEFDPWRFAALRDSEENALKHQYTHTTLDYLAFGHGRHACPGRFFAATELKAMMVHVLMHYDVKFARAGVRPPNQWVGLTISPDPAAEVMFRRRDVSDPVLKNG